MWFSGDDPTISYYYFYPYTYAIVILNAPSLDHLTHFEIAFTFSGSKEWDWTSFVWVCFIMPAILPFLLGKRKCYLSWCGYELGGCKLAWVRNLQLVLIIGSVNKELHCSQLVSFNISEWSVILSLLKLIFLQNFC